MYRFTFALLIFLVQCSKGSNHVSHVTSLVPVFNVAWYANDSKNVFKLNTQQRPSITNGNKKNKPSSSTKRSVDNARGVVLQRTAKKCTKIYNARAQLLFFSLNLLFGAVLIAVVVMVCLSSLMPFPTTTVSSSFIFQCHLP